MKSYQILAVIGGVLGMIIVFLVYAVFSVANIFAKSFGGGSEAAAGLVSTAVGISIFLYIIAIIIPFALKKPKAIGIILIILGFATLISASYFGIIGMVLLVAGGIAALRQQEKTGEVPKKSIEENTLDILKTRYAKGEITKEQFDEMKKRLDELEK